MIDQSEPPLEAPASGTSDPSPSLTFAHWCRLQWDRVAAALFAFIGLLCLLLGWIGVSSTVFPAEQIPYVASGGFGGIFCLGVAGILWLGAELSDEWRKLDRIDQKLQQLVVTRAREAGQVGGRDDAIAALGSATNGKVPEREPSPRPIRAKKT